MNIVILDGYTENPGDLSWDALAALGELTAPNCFITPHIAWAARESRQRLMDTAVDNLKQFLSGTP